MDQSYSWLVLATSFLAMMVADGMRPASAIYFAHFRQSFHCSAADSALFFALVNSACFVSGPVAGAAFLMIGGRNAAFLGTVMASAAFICISFTGSMLQVAILAVPIGVGFGLIRTSVIASQPQYFSKYRNTAMGFVMVSPGLGRFAFPVVLSMLIHEYGWRTSMIFNGAFVFHCMLVAAALRPTKTNKSGSDFETVAKRKSSNNSSLKGLLRPRIFRPHWKSHLYSFLSVQLWKDPMFLMLSAAIACAAGCTFIFFSMSMELMQLVGGLSPAAAAWTFSLHGVAELGGRLLATAIIHYANLPLMFCISWCLALLTMCPGVLFCLSQTAYIVQILLVGLRYARVTVLKLMQSAGCLLSAAAAWTFSLHGVAELGGRLLVTAIIHYANLPLMFCISWCLALLTTCPGVLLCLSQTAYIVQILLVGLSNGFLLVAMAPAFIDIFGVEKLPAVFGWIGGLFNGLGGLIFVKIGGELAEAYSLRAAFYMGTVCAVLSSMGIITVTVVVIIRQRRLAQQQTEIDKAEGPCQSSSSLLRPPARLRTESHSLSVVTQTPLPERPPLTTELTVEEDVSDGTEESEQTV